MNGRRRCAPPGWRVVKRLDRTLQMSPVRDICNARMLRHSDQKALAAIAEAGRHSAPMSASTSAVPSLRGAKHAHCVQHERKKCSASP